MKCLIQLARVHGLALGALAQTGDGGDGSRGRP